MLFPTRQTLVQDPKFLSYHKQVTNSLHIRNCVGSIQEELVHGTGVSDHPHVDMLNRHALRSVYIQGVMDFVEALMNYTEIPEEANLADYDWMEETGEKDA